MVQLPQIKTCFFRLLMIRCTLQVFILKKKEAILKFFFTSINSFLNVIVKSRLFIQVPFFIS